MNELIKQATTSKKIPNIFVASLLSLVFVFFGSMIFLVVPKVDMPDYLRLTIYDLILGFSGITLLVYLRVKFTEKRSFRSIGLEKEGAFKKFGLGYLVGLVMFSAIVLVAALFGGFKLEMNVSNLYLPAVTSILIGFIIQGSTEEVVFRGWLLPVVGARYNKAIAIIVSSVLFAFIHGMNPGITILPLINLVLFGVFAAVYALNEGSIWGICGYHAAWNWVQGAVYGIKVSGTTVPGGSLFLTTPQEGRDLISGGSFGLEGSILCSLAFIVGTLLILKKMKEKGQ